MNNVELFVAVVCDLLSMFRTIKINKKLLLLSILAGASIIRLIMMLSHSYTLDVHELMSLELADGADLLSVLTPSKNHWTESNGILYYYILNLWMKNHISIDSRYSLTFLSCSQIIWLKMLSVIPSFLSCYLVYKICQKTGSKIAGIYAAFLLAIHCGNICISDHIRFYSLNTFFGCLSTYLLLYLKFDKKNSLLVIFLYILSLLACTASMMCSSILIAGHFGYCIIKHSCKKKVLNFFTVTALLHGLFFCLLWLRDVNALERKAGYLGLFDNFRGLFLLFYNLGFGVIDIKSILTNYYGYNLNESFYINIFSCLFVAFFILVALHIFRYYGCNCLLFSAINCDDSKKSGKNSKDLLLLSLSLLIFPLAIMLLIYQYVNIINFGSTSFLQPSFVIFLAYFMRFTKKYIRWIFLIAVLASLPFSMFSMSSPEIILTWEHENSCYIIKNYKSDMVILSSSGYITVYQEETKSCFIFHYNFDNNQTDKDIEDYICRLIQDKPVQFWYSYEKLFDKLDVTEEDRMNEKKLRVFLETWLLNFSRRVKKHPSIITFCINSDSY